MTQTAPAPIPTDLIGLPGDAFVTRAVERLGLSDVSPREAHAMAQAVYRGVAKTRIWEALSARAQGRPIVPPNRLSTALVRPDDDIAMEAILIDHAPEDDAVFIAYAFFRLVGRDPELSERLQLQQRLSSGALDRKGVVAAIVATAQAEGRSPVVGQGEALAIVAGTRAARQLLIRSLPSEECLVADGALRQARIVDGGLELLGGLALCGPKRSLRAGLWRLVLDWAQADDAVIAIEVTSNGGADQLLSLTVAGPAAFNAEFRIEPDHLVSEVMIIGLRKGVGDWVVQPREVSLEWISE